MTKRPFFILAIFFSLGIIAEYYLKISFLPLFITALFLILLSFLFLRKNLVFSSFIIAFFLLLGALAYKNHNTLSRNHIYYQTPPQKTRAVCMGTIIEDPIKKASRFLNQKTSFKFRLDWLKMDKEWMPVEGDILVNLYGQKRGFEYADILVLEGSLAAPDAPTNPYQFNYKKFLANDKVFAVFSTSKNDLVKKIGAGDLNWVKKYAYKLRHKLKTRIEGHFSPPHSEILKGILLGFRQDIPLSVEELFIKTGTMHLLAISGLHVGLIIIVIMFFLKLTYTPRKVRFVLMLLFLLFYIPLTGSRIPVLRASIMAGVILGGLIFEREADVLNSLGIAVPVILLFNPNQIFSVGFQLSFICVLAIIYLAPKIENFFFSEEGNANKLSFYLRRSVCVSLAAWLGTLPLTTHYFNNVSFLSVVANLIAIPLSFLAIVCAILFIIFGYGLAIIPLTSLTSLAVGGLLGFLNLLSKISFGFQRTASWSLATIIVFYSLLIIVFNYRKLKIRLSYLIILALVACNIYIWLPLLRGTSDIMKVNFFDVGFADAILVELPHDKHMLVDTGSFKRGCGKNIIAPYLWNNNIKRLDAIVITHPESDHLGGVKYILENFEIGCVFDSGQTNTTNLYREYINTLKKKEIPLSRLSENQSIMGPRDVKVTVLHPPYKLLKGTSSDLNNNSVVLKLEYKEFSILLTGDVEGEGLKCLLSYKDLVKSDIVKLPHHGLELGDEVELLLETAQPEIAVISAGEGKYTKVKKTETMLLEKDIKVLNTARKGFVGIEVDGSGFKINTFKE